MEELHLCPPRWFLHVQFVGWLLGAAAGVVMVGAGLSPDVHASPFLVSMGVVFFVAFLRAAIRNYRVKVVLDDTTMSIHGWLWSRRVLRTEITAVWRGGHVQYSGRSGVPTSVWIVWLQRNGPDDEETVIGRLQRPWRTAEADLRAWAGVTNAL